MIGWAVAGLLKCATIGPFFDRPDNTYAVLLIYIFDPDHLVVPEILLLVEEICS